MMTPFLNQRLGDTPFHSFSFSLSIKEQGPTWLSAVTLHLFIGEFGFSLPGHFFVSKVTKFIMGV